MNVYSALISAILTFGSVFLAAYLSQRASRKESEKRYKQLRYTSAYIPFINIMFKCQLSDRFLIQWTANNRQEIVDLVSSNLHFYGPYVWSLYPDFYKAFCALEYSYKNLTTKLEIEASHKAYTTYLDRFCDIFNAILKEARELEAELDLSHLASQCDTLYRKDFQNLK